MILKTRRGFMRFLAAIPIALKAGIARLSPDTKECGNPWIGKRKPQSLAEVLEMRDYYSVAAQAENQKYTDQLKHINPKLWSRQSSIQSNSFIKPQSIDMRTHADIYRRVYRAPSLSEESIIAALNAPVDPIREEPRYVQDSKSLSEALDEMLQSAYEEAIYAECPLA